MEKLFVDIDQLVFAWQDATPENAYYLDLDTGSVILVCPELDDIDDLRDEIESEPGRFLFLPKEDPQKIELDMTDFVVAVTDEKLKQSLLEAMERRITYETMEQLLKEEPRERQRLKDWQKLNARQRVFKWLAAHAIEPA